MTLLRSHRHPSSTLGYGDVETQALLLHRTSERRDVVGGGEIASDDVAMVAIKAAAATRRMSAAAAPAAIARALFSFARHSTNSPRTVLNLGRLMAVLEGTEAAYCTTSGMSAIAAVLLQLVSAGGHVVASKWLYGGTHVLLSRACNIRATFVDANDTHAVRAAVHEAMVVSPARLRPDVVIHSVSKFISGGANIIAGY
ncbi:methionine gamma-lyase-like [Ananas comosus]|uniref:Methionine gamma-lyase-like n=1 Tax=Ananas comosus TaxID=4615 RepID=A0A6P5FFE8_ANACO|nr:methionine gamma-lyase-like [Ananas comosus]